MNKTKLQPPRANYSFLSDAMNLKGMNQDQLIRIITDLKLINQCNQLKQLEQLVVEKFLSIVQGVVGIIRIGDFSKQTYYSKERIISTYRTYLKLEKEFNRDGFWDFFQSVHKITLLDYQNSRQEMIQVIHIPIQTQEKKIGSINILGSPIEKLTPEEIYHISLIAEIAAVRIEAMLEAEEMARLANEDGLTRLFNRRYFEEIAEHDLERARRYHESAALIMLDIDHFKKINDTYGHPAGDHILKQLAMLLNRTMRKADWIARYGGEEFIIYLPGPSPEQAISAANRLRSIIEKQEILYQGHTIHISASIGLSLLQPNDSLENLIQRADDNLYQAKKNGRNRVVSDTPNTPVHSHSHIQ
ncbi:MAG: GGDEF domain-containing protein [Candidatus Delongbacteria bacterium]|nr:GGDEF domain-containing protein [Candidatus Delongbacteria bacterium]